MSATIATKPPKFIVAAMMIAMMKAAPAVMNQPPITDITPVRRPTALSRPQARSAREDPIATMKVT